jgi:hypothetical protein
MTEIRHHTTRANDIRQHYMEAGRARRSFCSMAFPKLAALGDIRSPSWLGNIGLSLLIQEATARRINQRPGMTSATWPKTCPN